MAQLGVAGAFTLLVLAPVIAAYYQVRTDQQLARSREDIARYSADVASYLEGSPALTLWGDTLSSAGQETDLFPGQTGQTSDWARSTSCRSGSASRDSYRECGSQRRPHAAELSPRTASLIQWQRHARCGVSRPGRPKRHGRSLRTQAGISMPLCPPMHPARLRQPPPGPFISGLWPGFAEAVATADGSSLTSSRYARFSRLAGRAPRRPAVAPVFPPASSVAVRSEEVTCLSGRESAR